MLRPFENLLAMRRATVLQGRITQQRDEGIWNEVWELSLHLVYLTVQILLVEAASLTHFCISHVCGVLFVSG